MKMTEARMRDLQGMSLERVRLMGMPHIGCYSLPSTKKPSMGRIIYGSECCLCRNPADNAHHLVPKGMGGGSSVFVRHPDKGGPIVLTSPLFAVCGMGNASGCHGVFHAGKASAEWVWDDMDGYTAWDDGSLWDEYGSNDSGLYALGHWVLRAPGLVRQVRS